MTVTSIFKKPGFILLVFILSTSLSLLPDTQADTLGFSSSVKPGSSATYTIMNARQGDNNNTFWDPQAGRAISYTIPLPSRAFFTVTRIAPWPTSYYNSTIEQVWGNLTIGNLTLVDQPGDILSDAFLIFAREFRGNFLISLDWAEHARVFQGAGGTFRAGSFRCELGRVAAYYLDWADQIQEFHGVFAANTGLLLHLNASIAIRNSIFFELEIKNTNLPIEVTHSVNGPFSTLTVGSIGLCVLIFVRRRHQTSIP